MGGIRRGPRRLLGSALTSRVSQFQLRSFIKSVQHGTIAVPDTGTPSTTATITAVDTNNSILLYSGYSLSGANYARYDATTPLLTFTNSTTITAAKGLSAGTGATVSTPFTVIEFYPGVLRSVQYGTIDLNNVTSGTATITTVDTTRAFVLAIGMKTTYANTTPTLGVGGYKLELTNATTVTATRQASSADSFLIGFVVAEFY
jgi:hypothetical protein